MKKEERTAIVNQIVSKWNRKKIDLSTKDDKEYFVPLPDNLNEFYAYINLVINNKENRYAQKTSVREAPLHYGPVKVRYRINEVNERFLVVNRLKDKKFLEMLIDQFTLLRTYWRAISSHEEYSTSDIYSDQRFLLT